eukprot:4782066-Alexandrium_andersonii.AAC.1
MPGWVLGLPLARWAPRAPAASPKSGEIGQFGGRATQRTRPFWSVAPVGTARRAGPLEPLR